MVFGNYRIKKLSVILAAIMAISPCGPTVYGAGLPAEIEDTSETEDFSAPIIESVEEDDAEILRDDPEKENLVESDFDFEAPDYFIYDGNSHKAEVTTLKQTGSITVKYKRDSDSNWSKTATDVGVYNVKFEVKESEKYNAASFEPGWTIEIKPATIVDNDVILTPANFTYDGKPDKVKEPSVTVVHSGNPPMNKDVDYTVTVVGAKTPDDTGSVTVAGMGNYTGTIIKRFSVNNANIASAVIIKDQDVYEYSGTPIEPNFTVKYNNVLLVRDTDYTFDKYEDNTKDGSGKIYIKGIGYFEGTKRGTFTIVLKKYTITQKNYDNKGVSSSKDRIATYGQKFDILKDPRVSGYDFLGWYLDAACSDGQEVNKNEYITADTIIYAKWAPKTYTVTLDSDGEEYDQDFFDVTFDDKYPSDLDNEPTKDGYNFLGWFTRETGGEQKTKDSYVKIAGDHTLYAHWEGKPLEVSFNVNTDDTTAKVKPNKITVNYGSTYGDLPKAERKGYDFLGWYTKAAMADCSEDDKVTADTEVESFGTQNLYAQWAPHEYTLTLNPNGGSVNPGSVKVPFKGKYGANCDEGKLPEPSRTGYTFNKWNSKATGGTEVNGDTTLDTAEDRVIYAQWTADSFDISFDSQGGTPSSPAAVNVTYDDKYPDLPTVTRDGFAFAGWYTEKNGKGTKIEKGGTVKIPEASTVYAYWKGDPVTITLDPKGGEVEPGTVATNYDAEYGKLPTPVWKGRTFLGWFKTETGGTAVKSTDRVDSKENYKLYAQWKQDEYTVTLEADGGTVESESIKVHYGEKYYDQGLKEAEKDGYTFEGWYLDKYFKDGFKVEKDTKVTTDKDHTLYARWQSGGYNVYFDANGGTSAVEKKRVAFDQPYGELPVPTNPGYRLTGWYTAKEGGKQRFDTDIFKLTKDETLYAHWEKANIIITLDATGGKVKPDTLTPKYLDTYGTLPIPERDDHIFLGWFTSSQSGVEVHSTDTVTATGSQVLYAHWKEIIYVKGIKLNKEELQLVAGKSETLSCSFIPENPDNKELSWKSSDERIVSVNEAGTVTALRGGKAVITVTSMEGKKKAYCTVTVDATEKAEFKDITGKKVTLIRDALTNTYKTEYGESVLVISGEGGSDPGTQIYQYTSKRIRPAKKGFVVYNGVVYSYKNDYYVKYKRNRFRGTATAIIRWKKRSFPYSQGIKKTEVPFEIAPREVSNNMINFRVRRKKIRRLTVTTDGVTMRATSRDFGYTSFKDGIIIRFTNNFSGTVKMNYIVPDQILYSEED